MTDISNALEIIGWMSPDDMRWLAIQASEHTNILELGSWKGRSTRAICDNTNGNVVSVDNWLGSNNQDEVNLYFKDRDTAFDIFKANLKDHLDSKKLQAIVGSTHTVMKELLEAQGHELFDMIFIDANHSFNSVKEDIEGSLPLLRRGGLICGHDYHLPGVYEAVNLLLNNIKTVDVIWYRV